MWQNSLPSGVGRSLGTKLWGGRGRSRGIFFGFYKTRHILLSDSANCTVLCAVVVTQYRRVTDGRTDGRTDGVKRSSITIGAGRQYVKACPMRGSTGSSPRLNSCCRSSWSILPPLWVCQLWWPAPEVSPDEGFRREAETSINSMLFWLYYSN